MQHVRANTETLVVVGPFVDKTDGITPETGITLGAADEAEILKHNTATVTDMAAATWAAVANCDGYYVLTLTAALTDTEGRLTVIVNDDSECLPVRNDFMVLSEAAYDSLYVAKDDGYMDVNVKAISEDTTAADNAEAFFDGTGYAGTNNVIPTVTTVTNQLTAAAIATGIWQDNISADFEAAGSIGKGLYTAGALPGTAGGFLKAGDNVATTFATLTCTGAFTISDGLVITCSTDSKSAIKATGGATAGIGMELIGTGTGLGLKATSAEFTGSATKYGLTLGNGSNAAGALSCLNNQANFSTIAILNSGAGTELSTLTTGAIDAAMNIAGAFTGNLSGSVGSVTTKTGYQLLATTGLGNQTADITGNLSGSVGSVTGTVGGIAGTLQTLDAVWAKIQKWLRFVLRKDAAIVTDHATELAEINANGGSGAGAFANTTDSVEAIRDRGDAAWITATGFSTHTAADVWSVGTRVLTAGTNIALAKGTGVTGFTDIDAAGVRTAVGLGSANLDTQLADIPTVAEFEARTIAAANYATAANLTTLDTLADRIAALCIGNVTGAGTGTEVFVYGGVTATVTVDSSGNRTLVFS